MVDWSWGVSSSASGWCYIPCWFVCQGCSDSSSCCLERECVSVLSKRVILWCALIRPSVFWIFSVLFFSFLVFWFCVHLWSTTFMWLFSWCIVSCYFTLSDCITYDGRYSSNDSSRCKCTFVFCVYLVGLRSRSFMHNGFSPVPKDTDRRNIIN